MDIQLKKGLLDTCVLAVLEREESYGYKLITDLSGIIEISESTLYPILKRLEISGCLITKSLEHGGRLRKYYFITVAGRQKLKDAEKDFSEMKTIYEKIFRGFSNGKN